MSLEKRLLENTLYQISGRAISTIFGIVAIGLMARYLGAEKYGWYVTALSFLQFIGIIIDLGLIPVSAQIFGSRPENKLNDFQNLLGFRLATALPPLIITVIISSLLPVWNTQIKLAIIISSIAFLANSIQQIMTGYLQSELKMGIFAKGDIYSRVALLAGVGLTGLLKLGFLPMIVAATLPSLVYVLYLGQKIHREIPLRPRFDFPTWFSFWQKAWPVAMGITFNVIYLRGDTLILSLTRSQTEVGIYGLAYKLLDLMSQTAMLAMGVILPLLANAYAQKNREALAKHYAEGLKISLLIGLPLAGGGLVLARPILELAGQEFVSGTTELQILMLAGIAVFFGAVYGHANLAIGEQKRCLPIYLFTAIITLIGYILFIPRFGMRSAAMLTLFSESLVAGLLFRHWQKSTKLKINSTPLLKIFLAALAMTIITIPLSDLPVYFSVALGAVAYLAFLLIFKAIKFDELRQLFGKKV